MSMNTSTEFQLKLFRLKEKSDIKLGRINGIDILRI